MICLAETRAQYQQSLAGSWEGILHVGKDLRMVFHFSRDYNGQWNASFDSPDQFASGIPCGDVQLKGDSVNLQVPSARAAYRGVFLNDSSVKGEWIQGARYELTLKKTEKFAAATPRKQTPIPPFPYQVVDTIYLGAATGLEYGATLTVPPGKGPFPAVVLITGSGAQDRDETIFGHKPFAVLADYLTRHSIMVLRVDDRGMGKSTGDFSHSTSLDFAQDVRESLEFLKRQPGADLSKLGLIGHSEGGMIAPIVASERPDIDFIILLAGPGEKISKLMAEQNAAILNSAGIKKEAVQSFEDFYPTMVQTITTSASAEEASRKMNVALDKWRDSSPKNYVLATTGIYNDSSQHRYVESMTQAMYNPWFLYFLRYDPAPYLEKLNCKVLALNGEKDVQVIATSNLAGIKKALEKSKTKNFEILALPQLNHLFQTCKSCKVQEYGQLEETFSPEAMEIISKWIDKTVK
jgi:pimeloyl-ACP methyl ester carboxylesterase